MNEFSSVPRICGHLTKLKVFLISTVPRNTVVERVSLVNRIYHLHNNIHHESPCSETELAWGSVPGSTYVSAGLLLISCSSTFPQRSVYGRQVRVFSLCWSAQDSLPLSGKEKRPPSGKHWREREVRQAYGRKPIYIVLSGHLNYFFKTFYCAILSISAQDIYRIMPCTTAYLFDIKSAGVSQGFPGDTFITESPCILLYPPSGNFDGLHNSQNCFMQIIILPHISIQLRNCLQRSIPQSRDS